MYKKDLQGWMKHLDFILLDILCLNIGFAAAYLSYDKLPWPPSRDYFNLEIVLVLIDFAVLIGNETMKGVLRREFFRELLQTVKHVALVVLIVALYLFAVKESEIYSRIFLGIFSIYYSVLTFGVRLLWKRFLSARRGTANTALYLITTCDRAEELVERYRSQRSAAHYRLEGICLLDLDQTGEQILGIPVSSNRDSVVQYLCREWVDEVVVSVPTHSPAPTDLIDELLDMGIVVHIELEQVAELGWHAQEVEKIADRTVLTVGINMATPVQMFLKRTMDIAGGLVGCVLTLLLTVVIGPMIYIKSPGPIFFTQTRVGKNGKRFKMYKFRSMYLDAEERKAELMGQNRVDGGLMFKLDYDPRIIGSRRLPDGTVKKGIGNFIRDWSLDEFPQFLNCLKGDLSLVGTRPPTVDEWEKYQPHHRARLSIKPGITGMWQVSGRSKITDFEQVVELDKKYIREWSLGLDIKILLQTVKAVLRRDGSM